MLNQSRKLHFGSQYLLRRPSINSSHDGFSLVELLVTITVSIVIFLAASQLIVGQKFETMRLKTKLELSGIQLDLQQSLADPATCLKNFKDIRIDESKLGVSSYSISISKLVDDALSSNPIVEVGVTPEGFTQNTNALHINASNFVKVSNDKFRFDVNIPFIRSGKFVVQVVRITRISIATDPLSPSSAKVPISCHYGIEEGGPQVCRLVVAEGSTNESAVVNCAADEEAVTGGGACLSSGGLGWEDAPVLEDEWGYEVLNQKDSSSSPQGWAYDCLAPLPDKSKSQAVVYCCKK